MATSQLKRASVFAIKEESTEGTLNWPTAATDFIPLRPGATLAPSLEELTNEELLNDIGAAKSYTGKESVDGSFPLYLKPKGASGFPNWKPFLKSAFGSENSMTSTDTCVTGTTASVIKVASTTGYYVGQALLINGEIRNVKTIDNSTDMTMNFAYSAAPVNGDVIAKCYSLIPAATGHTSFSVFNYQANGGALEATAGCRTNSISVDVNAGQQVECTIGYQGTKYFLNPIKITSSNKYIDIEENSTTVTAVALTEKTYRSPDELAEEMTTACTAATGETITWTFNSSGSDAGKISVTNSAGTFKLPWNTGANTANSIKTTLGFDNTDDTGAATYKSDSVITYVAAYTPSYDSADSIIAKANELFIGSSSENFCRKASSFSLSINTPTIDVDSVCSDTGVLEKLTNSREVTLNATLLLEKHQVALFTKMINNTGTQAMINLGNVSNGDFQAGKCVNFYFGNFSITSHQFSGDDVIVLELEGKGYVTSTLKDIYMNFPG